MPGLCQSQSSPSYCSMFPDYMDKTRIKKGFVKGEALRLLRTNSVKKFFELSKKQFFLLAFWNEATPKCSRILRPANRTPRYIYWCSAHYSAAIIIMFKSKYMVQPPLFSCFDVSVGCRYMQVLDVVYGHHTRKIRLRCLL